MKCRNYFGDGVWIVMDEDGRCYYTENPPPVPTEPGLTPDMITEDYDEGE